MGEFLAGRTVGFVVSQHGVEDLELTGPWEAARDAGAATVLIAPEHGAVSTTREGGPAGSYPVDWLISACESRDVDALVLPDGERNSLALREVPSLPDLVRAFVASDRPLGAFGFSVLSLLDAGVLEGRHVTSHPSLRPDLLRAGAHWHDRRVVVDDNLITSRSAQDVEAFNTQLIAYLDR